MKPVRAAADVMLMLLAAASVAGCRGSAPPPPHSLEVDSLEASALRTVPAAEVTDRTGPGGSTFHVALRTPSLVQHPCESCHVPGQQVRGAPGGAPAHANVVPEHPSELGARCATCHSTGAPHVLVLQSGDRAPLDAAYRLCAQCHFQQAEDWAAGAHGKRLGGWRGKRVVENCTGCHDPHAPGFPKRMPVEFPSIPRNSRGGD